MTPPSMTPAHAALFKSSADDHLAPLHPGEVLREDFLPHCKHTVETLARKLELRPCVLRNLVAERTSVNADLAAKLGEAFGMSGRYWLALQLQHDLWHSRVYAPPSQHPLQRRDTRSHRPQF